MNKNLAIYGLHAICWTAIAAICMIICQEKSRLDVKRSLYASLSSSFKEALQSIIDLNDHTFAYIEKVYNVYPRVSYQDRMRQIIAAEQLFDSSQHTISQRFDSETAGIQPDTFWRRLLHIAENHNATEDLFNQFIWPESRVWGENWVRRILQKADTSENRILLEGLQIRNAQALKYFLDYQASQFAFCGYFQPFQPVLVSEQIFPVIDHPCDLYLFLAAMDSPGNTYPSAFPPVRLWVNDREIPRTHRKFHYSETFDTPGQHPLRLRAEVRDPHTGRFKSYQRDYVLNVRPKN